MDWDLSPYFPSFEGPERASFLTGLETDFRALSEQASALGPLGEPNGHAWAQWTRSLEDLAARVGHHASYIACLAASCTDKPEYLRAESDFAPFQAALENLLGQWRRALASAADPVFGQWVKRPELEGLAWRLQIAREEARNLMTEAEESLASALAVDGLHAWSRLHSRLSSSLEFRYLDPSTGEDRQVPMSWRNSLLADSDREVRRRVFKASNTVLSDHEPVFSAALNGISGWRLSLDRRRRVPDVIDNACLQSRLQRGTLEALFHALEANRDLPRSILRWRASKEGRMGVSWFDLLAPLQPGDGPGPEPIAWDEAVRRVERGYDRSYPALGAYFRQMLEARWIDHSARRHKRPGGFCTGSSWIDQTRIFLTYRGTLNDLLTLAHEVGHAWHSHCLHAVRRGVRSYPMTLAETASTFSEQLVLESLLQDPTINPKDKLSALDSACRQTAIFLLDLPVRFLFERRVYRERAAGELDTTALCRIMVETQRDVFGDALEPGGEDPWFWASKLHFFITDTYFYNFPYTFGFLLSAALGARFRAEGQPFLREYERFLRLTGSASCETVARESLGADLSDPEFWSQAIRSCERSFSQLRRVFSETCRPPED